MPAHSRRVGPEHDPALGRRLLAEAGYPNGDGLPELTLAYFLGEPWEPMRDVLVAQLGEVGARVRVERFTVSTGPPAGAHLVWHGWQADHPDPAAMFDVAREQGLYWSGELEALVERAPLSRDRDERIRLYREVERLWIAEGAALVPLYYIRTVVRHRTWVDGFWVSPVSTCGLEELVVRR